MRASHLDARQLSLGLTAVADQGRLRVPRRRRRVAVVDARDRLGPPPVVVGSPLRATQDQVGRIDLGQLALGLAGTKDRPLPSSSHASVGPLDLALAGVVSYTKHRVVVGLGWGTVDHAVE